MSAHDTAVYLGDEADIIRTYFEDIGEFKPISEERERELSNRIQQGDLQARDKLVMANLRFVVDVAKSYKHRLPFADAISAGNLGLITAAERFDGKKGFKFISYAVWWIRQSILQTIAEQARTVRLPINKLALLKDILEASRNLQDSEGEPNIEKIATELNIAVEEVEDALCVGQHTTSLDTDFFAGEDDDHRDLLDVLADPKQGSPDEEIDRESARDRILQTLNSLKNRERIILIRYYGLDGQKPMTLEQIGALMGLTRERIRQIRDIALKKLKHPHYAEVWEETKEAFS